MRTFSLSDLTDAALLRELDDHAAQERTATAGFLARIAEVDSRRLYLPAGYSSMFAYCVDHLHLSEGAAYKRIQAARVVREFPCVLSALEDGKLHLSAVCLLRPHFTPSNADELVRAATHLKKSQVEELIARRFAPPVVWTPAPILRVLHPRPERRPPRRTVAAGVPGLLDCLQPKPELSPGTVEPTPPTTPSAALEPSASTAPGAPGAPSESTAPAAPPVELYLLRIAIDQRTHDKLRYAQALLSHAVPSGDVARILDRVLDLAIPRLEGAKFAATTRPGVTRRAV